ncbi:MAG: hypothetical protein F4Y07_03645 [Gemmatimonadetes bacterium]|nr:hypothetical protein [Gemmatimonadota bacterium]
MTSRRARNNRHRRGVIIGIGVSAALHGVVFGALRFQTAEIAGAADSASPGEEPALFDMAMEIVEIREVPEVEPEVVASDRPVITSPAPLDIPEPASTSMAAASASAAEIAAITPADLLAATALTSPSRSIQPRFAAAREIGGARQEIGALDPHAGHDHGDEEEEGEGFWQKLGLAWGKVPMGSGGGKICKPPKPVVVVRQEAMTR